MARMTCVCGAELNNHEAPNDIELVVYTDKEWNEICDCDSIPLGYFLALPIIHVIIANGQIFHFPLWIIYIPFNLDFALYEK